jgi:hypothetical protein
VHGLLDTLVVDEPLHPAQLEQPVVEALLGSQVGVLEIDEVQLGVRPLQAVAVAVGVEQLQLRHPVQLVGALEGVTLEPGEHRLPALQDVPGGLVGLAAPSLGDVALGEVEVLPLQLDGRHRAPVPDLQQVGERRVVGDVLE